MQNIQQITFNGIFTILSATCRAYGITYQHGDPVESTDICQKSCSCVKGRIFCVEIICALPDPEVYVNCRATYSANECCPQYDCGKSKKKIKV